MKIIVGGPPRSGKSCLIHALKETIKMQGSSLYPYVITACPDGEGAWFQPTMNADPKLGQSLKSAKKGKFSPGLVELYSQWVRQCKEPLTLVDIGGVPDTYNEAICQHASHAILLSPTLTGLAEWRRFVNALNIKVIAELESLQDVFQEPPLKFTSDCYRGVISGLNRGDTTAVSKPVIVQLAKLLIQLAERETPNLEDTK